MKAIHLTAYGNPAQNLRMVEVSEPDAPSDAIEHSQRGGKVLLDFNHPN